MERRKSCPVMWTNWSSLCHIWATQNWWLWRTSCPRIQERFLLVLPQPCWCYRTVLTSYESKQLKCSIVRACRSRCGRCCPGPVQDSHLLLFPILVKIRDSSGVHITICCLGIAMKNLMRPRWFSTIFPLSIEIMSVWSLALLYAATRPKEHASKSV
jgi:hypothetical protein